MKSHQPLFMPPEHLRDHQSKSTGKKSSRRVHMFWVAIATGGIGLLIVLLFVRNAPIKPAYSGNQPSSSSGSASLPTKQLCHRDRCRTVELASTPTQRQIGLMNRTALDPQAGMLFVFEETGRHPFWMKNTLIPLDMIWMDENYTIVSVQTAQPCTADPCRTYDPLTDARYVLELNAGQAQQYGLTRGETMEVRDTK